VEDRLGRWRFLGAYLVLGVVAGLAYAYMYENSTTPCVGASGAISGVMGLYTVLFPAVMLRVTFLLQTVRVPALFYLALWFAMQALAGPRAGIAVEAHLGGFLAGAWLGGAIRILRLGKPAAGKRKKR
jgi:membrane associated rhomboid family serine protease